MKRYRKIDDLDEQILIWSDLAYANRYEDVCDELYPILKNEIKKELILLRNKRDEAKKNLNQGRIDHAILSNEIAKSNRGIIELIFGLNKYDFISEIFPEEGYFENRAITKEINSLFELPLPPNED